MKEILLSVKPEWLAKILNGEKTIELRKTMPRCDLPCKVWLYCSKGKKNEYLVKTNKGYEAEKIKSGCMPMPLNGQVVGYFILRNIKCFEVDTSIYDVNSIYELKDGCREYLGELQDNNLKIFKESCLSVQQLEKYLINKDGDVGGMTFYAWQIDDLKILEKPFDLRNDGYLGNPKTKIAITKAPQSWCYCENNKDCWVSF